MMLRAILVTAMLLAPLGAPLQARSPNDVAEVREGLLAAAVGDVIRRQCETIVPRVIRVYNLRNQLLAAAQAAGFSEDEIDAFVDDPIAKENLKAEAAAYLSARGADPQNASSYCAVGTAEIADDTSVGRLLRAR